MLMDGHGRLGLVPLSPSQQGCPCGCHADAENNHLHRVSPMPCQRLSLVCSLVRLDGWLVFTCPRTPESDALSASLLRKGSASAPFDSSKRGWQPEQRHASQLDLRRDGADGISVARYTRGRWGFIHVPECSIAAHWLGLGHQLMTAGHIKSRQIMTDGAANAAAATHGIVVMMHQSSPKG